MANNLDKREDVHSPVHFNPENYVFVGATDNALHTDTRLLQLVQDSPSAWYGDGRQCDHCGARIRYIGVFKHIPTGDHIAVGEVCLGNRFPLSKAEFDRLRKAARLDAQRRKNEQAWADFKAVRTDVPWDALYASTDPFVQDTLKAGAKWGNLFDWKIGQLKQALVNEALVAQAAAAPVKVLSPAEVESFLTGLGRKVAFEDVTPELIVAAQHWLADYRGTFEFLVDLRSKGRLSAGQAKGVLNCWRADISRREMSKNQDAEVGIYVAADNSIWKVQGNRIYNAAVKRGDDPKTVRGARVYAKVWAGINGERLTLEGEKVHGDWEYVPNAIAGLDVSCRMSLEQAKKFILKYGSCVRCGRHLEAAASVERGIGPVCVKYFQNWGKP